MSESSLLWLAGVAVSLILGLVAVVYAALRARDDRTEQRLDGHLKDAAEADQRLARVETQVSINTSELKSVRDRTHRLEADAAYKRHKARHGDGPSDQ